ncbi:hypothetical protein BUALT_Bualt13G0073000 [Buddleja alternifolia]|uniref:Uncharacterized protein n=1 Tax=Buddleja alternifolia TaxID=168488 RepID=A0AAV6WT54_9LAMI|nr:hypothetical protein BUALT_Bualt13G0073000 [Buddleja alternifolia]
MLAYVVKNSGIFLALVDDCSSWEYDYRFSRGIWFCAHHSRLVFPSTSLHCNVLCSRMMRSFCKLSLMLIRKNMSLLLLRLMRKELETTRKSWEQERAKFTIENEEFKRQVEGLRRSLTMLALLVLVASCDPQGQIPDQLSYCKKLVSLHLNHNHLFREIPISLGEMPVLGQLDLSENDLTGEGKNYPQDTNHASIDVITNDSQHKVLSLSSSAKAPPALQFRSLEPAMVKVLLVNEGTMSDENSIDKFEEDGEWILVTRRRRQRRCIDELHPLFLKKSYSPTVGKPNPVKALKTPHVNFKKSSKSNHRTLVTLDDFFPKNFFESKVNPKGKEIVTDVHVQPGNTSKIQPKVTRSNDYQVMAKGLIMPITKINSSPVKIPCQKFQRTFSLNVYKFLEKSGYDFSNPLGLGKLEPELIGEKIHGLTKAQHKLRKQGYHMDQPKIGLGFALAKTVTIRVTKKEKCVNVQHISVEGDGKGKKPSDNRVSVFDRLSTTTARPPVFGRLGSSSRIPNLHDKLGLSNIPQSSIFNRLGGGSPQRPKKRNHDGETESRSNNQTLILSQPQESKSSLVLITIDGTVKVKQRIISNSHRSNENNPNEDEVEVIIDSNYATVDEDSNLEASDDEI